MARDIEELEAELQRSRFEVSEAEKLLVRRHEARIAALTKTEDRWGERWALWKAVYDECSLSVGRIVFPLILLLMLTGIATAFGAFGGEVEPPPLPTALEGRTDAHQNQTSQNGG